MAVKYLKYFLTEQLSLSLNTDSVFGFSIFIFHRGQIKVTKEFNKKKFITKIQY